MNFADYFFISNKIPWRLASEKMYVFESSGAFVRKGNFQTDLCYGLACGDSVVLKMIQIAYYLGFKELYLIGVDLDYVTADPYFYSPTDKEKKRTPDMEHIYNQLQSIDFAGKFLAQKGVRLINASPGGIVKCIERCDYNSLFNSKVNIPE